MEDQTTNLEGLAKVEKKADLVPMTMMLAGSIQQNGMDKPLLVLFDSGSQANWMRRGALPSGVNGKVVKQRQGSTVAGSFSSSVEIDFQGIRLPEFYRNRTIDGFKAMVFNADCRYDVILGRDFLSVVGLQLDWKDHVMTWDEVTVPMKLYPAKSPNVMDYEFIIAEAMLWELLEADLADDDSFDFDDDLDGPEHDVPPAAETEMAFLTEEEERQAMEAGYKSKVILPSHYKKVDVHDIARSCTHLPLHQQNKLAQTLE